MMRLVALAILLAACGTRPCKEHTVLVTLTLEGASAAADHALLSFSIAGGAAQDQTVALSGHSTTIEVDFGSGYPAGKSLAVHVVAEQDGAVVGSGDGTVELGGSCEPLGVAVGAAPDAGIVDLGSDLGESDGAMDLGRCSILYVSPTGVDTNDGCSIATPLATISQGIAKALPGAEVHVCKGEYYENGIVVKGVLRGGYSCSTWEPQYLYPTFDTNAQTLVGTNVLHTPVTITIPVDAPADTVIDGFFIAGGVSLSGGSVALQAFGPALIQNNVLQGDFSGSTTSGVGAIALEADGDEEVVHNKIFGGGDTTSDIESIGSIGVYAHSTTVAPSIHDNIIEGGSGVGGRLGSIGIVVDGTLSFTEAAGTAIANNQILGGSGSAATGILVGGSVTVDVVGCSISATEAAEADKPVGGTTQGLELASSGNMRVLQNRIFGGSGDSAVAIAIDPAMGGTVIIESNMIHTGFASDMTSTPIAVGVNALRRGTTIVHNTIIGSNDASMHELVLLAGNLGTTVVDDNILAGSGGATTIGIAGAGACLGTTMSIHDNLTFNTSAIATNNAANASCGGVASYTSDDALNADFAIAAGNYNLASTCVGDTHCIEVPACSSDEACLEAIFSGFDATTDGLATLFTATPQGWMLTDHTPCVVAAIAATDTPTLSIGTDVYGTMWPASPSMGADEHATCGK